MFNSPTEFCSKCGQWVALDQTRLECAVREACKASAAECSLQRYFISGLASDSRIERKAKTKE